MKAAAIAVTGARSATAKAASTKAAAGKTVTTRLAARTTTKAGPAKAGSAKAGPAKAVPAKAAAQVAAKVAPAKVAPAKVAPAAGVPAKAAAPAPAATATVRRPTPHPRRAAYAVVRPDEDTSTPSVIGSVASPGADAVMAPVAAPVAPGRFASAWRRSPSPRRRPALYLAAALVTATSLGTITAGDPQAVAATPVVHSVSIARALGVDRLPDSVTAADGEHLQQLAASRNQRGAEQVAAAQVQAAADQQAAQPKCVLPVAGARLTSTFGMRWGVLHAGIDLAAPIGTPEYAAMDGVVLRAGPASGFGLAVYIQHANGDVTVYGHMEQILVTEGQVVQAGQTIALLGRNGQATGPHLHFEVHVGGMMGAKIDPLPWLRARGVAI